MIVQWFAQMMYKIVTSLLGWINLPHLPEDIDSSLVSFFTLIGDNAQFIFSYFIPGIVIKVGIPIVLIVTAFKYGYYFVMWILKKIPMIGIS